jgi:hypothetical protein
LELKNPEQCVQGFLIFERLFRLKTIPVSIAIAKQRLRLLQG